MLINRQPLLVLWWQQLMSVLLGLFILWQLLYFLLANSLETLEVVLHRVAPATAALWIEAIDHSRRGEQAELFAELSKLVFVIDKYGQLTAQPQRWSLFAPNINDQANFLACELSFDDGGEPIWLMSDNEPDDLRCYFRCGGNRLRSVEQNLTLTLTFEAYETEQQARQRWAKQIREKISRDSDVVWAWMQTRLAKFQQQYPQAPPPVQITLHTRGYQIAPPGTAAGGPVGEPYSLPLARWQAGKNHAPGMSPLDVFDPTTNQFVAQPLDTDEAE